MPTTDEALDYAAGFAYGLGLRFLSASKATAKIVALDVWAWDREMAQNLEGENPNFPMSDKQVAEAKAWGAGARKARGLNPPYPVPPYYQQP